ncbi:MAG: BamA/TamA family outer membrane protein [Candidatus Cloacimonetes bacterium]|nr:BamA/TamA family outer membrane protein [Candidatus Cloacimonadota bacterium]
MKKYIVLLTLLIVLTSSLNAAFFGKNKTNLPNLKWSVMKTTHFDIYYEEGLDIVGQITTVIVENAYYRFQDLFEYSLPHKIPVLIYNSHNEFEETNILYQIIEEGVGGFTEFIKNRVVVPFDGDYKIFETTVVHELCHVFMYFSMQGGSFANVASGLFYSLPFWFSEGLPEWSSEHGSASNEMYIRDLIINDKLVPLEYVSGYYAYREGESFLIFLEEKFGSNSIIELLYNFRLYKSIDEGAKRTFGFGIKSLEEQWRYYLQKKYSTIIDENVLPDIKYQQLTKHDPHESNANWDPVFSPDGTQILYYSNKNYTLGIYKRSTLGLYKPKKIITSGYNDDYEGFHYLKTSLSYFPDGERFSFVAKTSDGDDIVIARVSDGKELQRITLDFKSIFEIDVSPDGNKIILVGLQDAQNDLYVYNLKTKSLSRITDDYFDDRYPRWSSDGKKIVFSSQRFITEPFQQEDEHLIFSNLYYNVFMYDIADDSITALTDASYDHQYPSWTKDQKNIVFSAYRNEVSNIFVYDFEEQAIAQLTNIFSGTFSPCVSEDNSEMVFSSFYNMGWDLYLYSNPLDSLTYIEYQSPTTPDNNSFEKVFHLDEFRRFYRQKETVITEKSRFERGFFFEKDTLEAKPEYREDVEPEVEEYKIKFTPDFLFGGLAYTTGYGVTAQVYISLSDILGNHQIDIFTDVNKNLSESNVILNYYYIKKRIDYGAGLFNLIDDYYYLNYWYDPSTGYVYDGMKKDRSTGINALVSYPLDKFNRVDLYNSMFYNKIEWYWWNGEDWQILNQYTRDAWVYAPTLIYTHDTALWGITGPIKGSRYQAAIQKCFGSKNDYLNIYGDFRKYIALNRKYQLAGMFNVGFSTGLDKQDFIMGGYYNLRGYLDKEFLGHNIAIGSVEFRYPFIEELKLGFPLPLWIRSIRGAIFADVGKVWDTMDDFKNSHDHPVRVGYGIGTRMNLGYFILKFDWAWKSTKGFESAPSFYFSLDAEF